MHALVLFSLLSSTDAGTAATLTELLEYNEPSTETLDDWRRRATDGHRAFLERWRAATANPQSPESARAAFAMLVDYAMSLDDDDGTLVTTRMLAFDDVQRGFDPDAPLIVSREQRAALHETAVERATRSPTNELLWKLSLQSAPDDDDVHSLVLATQCLKHHPASRACRAVRDRLKTPRCEKGNLRKQVRWLREGRELNRDDIAVLEFKPDAPSDVLVKLNAAAPSPAMFMIRTPMRDTDIQLFDGEKLIGYAEPPRGGAKTVALRTMAKTLGEAVKLLCAKPTVTQLPKR